MQTAIGSVLRRVLALLVDFAKSGTVPNDAVPQMQRLQDDVGDKVKLRLLWQRESYDGQYYFDASIELAEGSTVIMSLCPTSDLPWPFRNLHYWKDSDIVAVNGTVITVSDTLAWDGGRWAQGIVDSCLLQQAAMEKRIAVSDEEVKIGTDHFFGERHLLSEEAIEQWMLQRNLDRRQLKGLVARQILNRKLCRRISEGREADYFQEHGEEFRVFYVMRLTVADATESGDLVKRLRSSELNIYQAAMDYSPNPSKSMFAAYVYELPPLYRDALEACRTGDIVGPIEAASGWEILYVLKSIQPVLDDRTILSIQQRLFDEWLEAHRKRARVQWFVGPRSEKPL